MALAVSAQMQKSSRTMNLATLWLANKLGQYDVLSEEEKAVLARLPEREGEEPKGKDIVVEGSRPTHSTLLIEGFCARYSILPDGKRQITAIHIPGDFVDLHSFLLKKMDHGVVTLAACRIAEVPHRNLRLVTEEFPHLARLLWLNTLVDGAIHRQWLVAMGAQNALGHLAHFTCEMYVRLSSAGGAADYRFHLPMTQTELGDALGLSYVHVNRSLQDLRGKGLVSWQGSDVEILDWDGLQDLAMFDPAYLFIEREPR